MSLPRSHTRPSLPHHVHMVGIGGAGLSAIARVLAQRGHVVSGSDMHDSPVLSALRGEGIRVSLGHDGAHIAGAELVVASSAVPDANVEILAARQRGVPVLKRQAFLPLLLRDDKVIAVAGTHGKTTTTAMIATVLDAAGLSPSFVVGGEINAWETNARAGSGPWFVIEADEYDRMFLGLEPTIAVVTNIEMDHPDCYPDMRSLYRAFCEFLSQVPSDGHIVACTDSAELVGVLADVNRGDVCLTYGSVAHPGMRTDWMVGDVASNASGGVHVDIRERGSEWTMSMRLSVPGAHNALNATAAWLVARLCGVPGDDALRALATYAGVQRRFQVKGESGGVLVVDDYAHHPTEIRATLAAARMRYPDRRLWAIFQPHTYSRTEALLSEFAQAFGDADHVVIADVFAARSKERPTVTSADLVRAMQHPDVRYGGPIAGIAQQIRTEVAAGDVVLTLGAGNSFEIGEELLRQIEARADAQGADAE